MQVPCGDSKKFQIATHVIDISQDMLYTSLEDRMIINDRINSKACLSTRSRVNQSRPFGDIYCCRGGNIHLFLLIDPGARTDRIDRLRPIFPHV